MYRGNIVKEGTAIIARWKHAEIVTFKRVSKRVSSVFQELGISSRSKVTGHPAPLTFPTE